MANSDKDLKLIYVLKIGYNSKGEGLYEFIFSIDPSNILVEDWMWDMSPACDNAEPPEEEYVDRVYNLKTSTFDLFCLHEAVDREYMHGFHTIHSLAYEIEKQDDENGNGFSDYDKMFNTDDEEETPLLVFHYGMSLERIKILLDSKKIILKGDEFIEASKIEL